MKDQTRDELTAEMAKADWSDPTGGRKGWSLHDVTTGEKVFESDDPQEFVDKAHELEQEAINRGPRPGVAASSYKIEGDPFELGVVQEHRIDKAGRKRLVRGPKELRRPTGVKGD